jgi:hypothetical protein
MSLPSSIRGCFFGTIAGVFHYNFGLSVVERRFIVDAARRFVALSWKGYFS